MHVPVQGLEPTQTAAAPTEDPPDDRRRPSLGRTLQLADAAAILVAWCVVGPMVIDGAGRSVALLVVIAVAVTPLAMAGLGLYRSVVCASAVAEMVRVLVAVAGTLGVLGLVEAAAHLEVDTGQVALASALCACFLVAERRGFRAWVKAERAAGRYQRPLVLVGCTSELQPLATFYEEHPEVGYRVVAVAGDVPDGAPAGVTWLGSLHDPTAIAAVKAHGGAALALSGLPSATANELVRRLTADGVHVHLYTGLTRVRHGRLRAMTLAHEPLHYFDTDRTPRAKLLAKRAIDMVGASLALVLTGPVLLLALAIVRRQDGAPPLFRQRRVGLGGEEFELLKIRTMEPDADARRDELRHRNMRSGPLFKVEDDPRITRIGRWLRSLSLDELPQLVNVLRGDMSLVGPRPAMPDETARFDDELMRRHRVRPGMTGLWQIEARDNPSSYVYRQLDLFYVENWTLAGDAAILLRTVWVVLVRGARSLARGEQR
jgi:exopolysaccharide biosynthesis polyprenyl glycosylphosphotransferase